MPLSPVRQAESPDAFDFLGSFERYGRASDRAARTVAKALTASGKFDPKIGRVALNAKAVSAAVRSAPLSKATAADLARWTSYLVEGGVATVPGPGKPALIPWRALEDVAVAGQGTTPELRSFYGIKPGMDGEDAAARLHSRFPGLSDDVFTPPVAMLLARDTEIGGGGGGNGRDPVERPPPGGGAGPSSTRPATGGIVKMQPAKGDVDAAGRCFAHGIWTGIDGGNGFGSWLLGFRVCFDHACAQTIGATFTWLNPATQIDPTEIVNGIIQMMQGLFNEIVKLKNAADAQPIPSIEPLVSWIVFAAGAGVPLLGDAITKADAGNGVCLYFSWFGPFWVTTR